MNWVCWILIANASVLYLEWAYRIAKYPSFWQALPYVAIPVLTTQLGLFYGFRQAPNLFLCAATFTVINTVSRVATVIYIGEKMSLANWAGVVFLLIGVILLKLK
jgi:uncharacterized membrane protein